MTHPCLDRLDQGGGGRRGEAGGQDQGQPQGGPVRLEVTVQAILVLLVLQHQVVDLKVLDRMID